MSGVAGGAIKPSKNPVAGPPVPAWNRARHHWNSHGPSAAPGVSEQEQPQATPASTSMARGWPAPTATKRPSRPLAVGYKSPLLLACSTQPAENPRRRSCPARCRRWRNCWTCWRTVLGIDSAIWQPFDAHTPNLYNAGTGVDSVPNTSRFSKSPSWAARTLSAYMVTTNWSIMPWEYRSISQRCSSAVSIPFLT